MLVLIAAVALCGLAGAAISPVLVYANGMLDQLAPEGALAVAAR